jgi:hypothetical protein
MLLWFAFPLKNKNLLFNFYKDNRFRQCENIVPNIKQWGHAAEIARYSTPLYPNKEGVNHVSQKKCGKFNGRSTLIIAMN